MTTNTARSENTADQTGSADHFERADHADPADHTERVDRRADHTNPADDGRHAFDFLAGSWKVHHRKLAAMTDPECDTWVEFEGVQWMRQTLGGLGNVDNVRVDALPDGRPFEGMSVRLFDPEDGLWRIWWASTGAPGHLDPPVTGRWTGRHGVFHGEDVVGGRPVAIRFDWTVLDADTARWEQAFSFDGGRTWVHNWRMSFTRLAE